MKILFFCEGYRDFSTLNKIETSSSTKSELMRLSKSKLIEIILTERAERK